MCRHGRRRWRAAKVVREDLSGFAEIVGRTRPAHWEAGEAPQGAAVVDREVIAVVLPNAKGVIPVGKVAGDKVLARAGQVTY
jgi:hypothetical protein